MVSLRRRRLLGLSCATQVNEQGQASHKHVESVNLETTLVTGAGSSIPSPPKEHINHPFPEVKHRKKYRRKNQGQCSMTCVYLKNRKWQAAIKVDKKQIHLGTFGSEEEAARLYDRAAFMRGRECNFELSEEEKQELTKFTWEEFLAITRAPIKNKKSN